MTTLPPVLRCAAPAAAAIGLHLALLIVYVVRLGGDPSALVCVDRATAGQPPFEAIRVGFPGGGYDGQFYYAIARAPWRPAAAADCPPARHLRILYPLTAWLASAGDSRLLLWALPAINLACIGLLAGLGARVALQSGLSPWWGLTLPLAVNAGLPALRNLGDPLSTLAVCGLLLAWQRRSGVAAFALWAGAAAFSREQNVAILALMLAGALWQRRRPAALGVTLALAAWAVWVGVLWACYGSPPFLRTEGNFGVPFAGMWQRWTHLAGASGGPSALLHLLRMGHLTAEVLLAAYLGLRGTDRMSAAVGVAGALLALVAGTAMYADAWSYTRVFAWLPLGIWLGAIATRRRWAAAALLPAGLWPLAALVGAGMP